MQAGKRWRRVALLVLALGVLRAPHVLGNEYPQVERGFKPARAYEIGDIDHVGLLSGGLTITIPIGQRYVVGPTLSYQLTLTYSSQLWDYSVASHQTFGQVTQAHPVRGSNAGFGWRLSLGEYWPSGQTGPGRCGDCYIAPDAARHPFFPTLHPDLADDGPTRYTWDGTFLRLRTITGGREIDFPTGEIHKFDSSGRLVQMRDPFGNQVNVEYGATTWTITDTHGRSHTVNLTSVPHFVQAIDNVDLETFLGGRSIYDFTYSNQSVKRSCLDSDPQTSEGITLPLLTSVALPDSSAYSMPVASYDLVGDYHSCLTYDYSVPTEGLLKKVRLPTLGSIGWTYHAYNFPVPVESIDDPEPLWLAKTTGVATRTLYNAADVALGTWQYEQSLPGGQQALESVTKVSTPLGDRTDHYFNVAKGENPFYGLPFSPLDTPTTRSDVFRSSEVYNCDATGQSCSLVRTTYLKYVTSPGLTQANPRVAASQTTFHDDGNRWIAVDHSHYDGMGHYRRSETSSNFDPAHSRVRVSFRDYNRSSKTYPGDFTMWPVGSPWVLGTYGYEWVSEKAGPASDFTTAVRSFAMEPATGWVSRTRIHRHDVFGVPIGNSVPDGRSNADVVIVTDRDGAGNLAGERYYGGDQQTLAIGDLLTLGLPAAPAYRIDHTSLYGVRATSTYVTSNGSPMSFKSLDCDIDRSTSLPRTCRDTSNIGTSYEYDFAGRLRWSKPMSGHDGWTEYVYSRATSATALAKVNVYRRQNGATTGSLADSSLHFDALGRLWQEKHAMADGNTSTREILYNAMGWRSSISEQGTVGKRTELLSYDPFGRPTTIRPPDGSALLTDHDVIVAYKGTRSVERTVKIATSLGGYTAAKTTELYDTHGRLYQVTEDANSSAPNPATTATYFYDVDNHVVRVQQQTAGGGQSQDRYFSYDRRGFLLSETHPEKGAGGNGSVTYYNYDARGHAGRRVDGPFDLTFAYDAAERLTLVRDTGVGFNNCTDNGGRRCWKQLNYGTSNTAGIRTNGRLELASRFNHAGHPYNVTVEVIENYTYGGRQGRVSRKDTRSNFAGSPTTETWAQTYTYTALGDVLRIGYPRCTWTNCTPMVRNVDHTYSNGFLNGVVGFASPITYHANGRYKQIAHSNGVVDTQTNDPNGMARPRELASQRSGADLWHSGAYEYDGAGNVKRIGLSYFLYDRVSRLIDGHVYDRATQGLGGSLRYQTYTYDAFANLTSIGGDPWAPGRATTTSAGTNRLTSSTYDAAGNMTGWNGPGCGSPGSPMPANPCYEYDAMGMITRVGNGSTGQDWRYIYTADDERFWSVCVGCASIWTLRDLDGKVLREYDATSSTWTRFKDYVYREGQLLAAVHTTEGQQHFHLDHLGTPRVITRGGTVANAGFYTVTPCRVLDSRSTTALGAGTTRRVAMTGACGIPSDADAVSVNVTALQATSRGEMVAYPATESRASASMISYPVTTARANNAVLKLGAGALEFYNNQPSGSVHLIVDVNGYFRGGAGSVQSFHAYFPFGEEVTGIGQSRERMKFTGHQRDLGVDFSANDDLDHMHARFYNPQLGRFLRPDPVPPMRAAVWRPQFWNLYSYTANSPMKWTDPDGEFIALTGCPGSGAGKGCRPLEVVQETFAAAGAADVANSLVLDAHGRISPVPPVLESSSNFTVRTLARAINDPGAGFHLTVVTKGFEDSGGAHIADMRRKNTYEISLNPSAVTEFRTRMENRATGQRFAGAVTLDEAFMHEVGHFFSAAIMSPRMGLGTRQNNAMAVEYENRHRSLKDSPRKHLVRLGHTGTP